MTGPIPYHTGKFPPASLDWSRLIPLLGPTAAALARYDGLLQAIPNANVLLSPLTTQEAVLSSRIEGTQATMGEVLEFEAAGSESTLDPAKRGDAEEILNYRDALRAATIELKTLPLCNRLIKSAHQKLLAGVRGHDKSRGNFRTIQNYIGAAGTSIEHARFVPIDPQTLPDGMAQWESYLHKETPDLLVQLALVHAEFESLHPFLDGNGRIGRMIIPLFLFARDILHAPTFYLSEYLEAHRQEYCDRLLSVSRDDDWTGWCVFFLQALSRQARDNEAKTRRILTLYQQKKEWMVKATHSQYAIHAWDFLFQRPVFKGSAFVDNSSIPDATARRLLKVLREEGLLHEVRPASGRKPAIFAFKELLSITEGKPIFERHP